MLGNQPFVAHNIRSEPLFKGLLLKNSGFELNMESDSLVTMISLLVHGRSGSMGRILPAASPLAVTLIMAEGLTPGTPPNVHLPAAEAVLRIVEIVQWLKHNDRIATYTNATAQTFTAIQGNVVQNWNNVNADTVFGILSHVAAHATRPYVIRGITLIVNVIVAVTKRGHLTESSRRKIQDGLKDDLNIDWNVQDETVALFYKHFCGSITDLTIGGYVDGWLSLVPEVALWLRLCLQQVAASGLTAYLTVGRALATYPEFPWHHIANILPADWANFRLACTTVGGNQYYGFRNDLDTARSTKFRSLTYIAASLLTVVGGERAIR